MIKTSILIVTLLSYRGNILLPKILSILSSYMANIFVRSPYVNDLKSVISGIFSAQIIASFLVSRSTTTVDETSRHYQVLGPSFNLPISRNFRTREELFDARECFSCLVHCYL
jgi:hypothetical protein